MMRLFDSARASVNEIDTLEQTALGLYRPYSNGRIHAASFFHFAAQFLKLLVNKIKLMSELVQFVPVYLLVDRTRALSAVYLRSIVIRLNIANLVFSIASFVTRSYATLGNGGYDDSRYQTVFDNSLHHKMFDILNRNQKIDHSYLYQNLEAIHHVMDSERYPTWEQNILACMEYEDQVTYARTRGENLALIPDHRRVRGDNWDQAIEKIEHYFILRP